MKSTTILPVGITVAIGLMILIVSWRRDRPDPTTNTQRRTDDHLEAQVTKIEKQLARLRTETQLTQLSTLAAHAVHDENAERVPQLTPEDTEELAAQQAVERSEGIVRNLDEAMVVQPVDREWATATLRELQSALEGLEGGGEILAADCVTTLCRVRIRHEDLSEQQNSAIELSRLQPFAAGTYFHYNQDADQPEMTLYVVREGHDFSEILDS